MKSKIWHKYAFSYLTVVIVMVLAINVVGYQHMRKAILKDEKEKLYKEVVQIVDEYSRNLEEKPVSKDEFLSQLRVIDIMLDAELWVISSTGNVISGTNGEPKGEINLTKMDEDFLDRTYIENATFPGFTTEPMLCVVEPMVEDVRIKGYIVAAMPMARIEEKTETMIFNTNVIAGCVLAVFLFIMIWLSVYHTRNFDSLIKATVAYTDGDFSNEMVLRGHDEYRELGNAVHYLAEQHSNLVNYQKNFIANISHDFRSPLTSIKGYAEAMKDGTIPYEIQGKYLNIILFETDRLSNLTNDLLDLSNFENKGVHLEFTKFDIVKMMKQSAMTFEGKCSQKNLRIRLVFAENEIFVYADRGKIQQVIHNLIDNAIKFSHPDSTIEATVMERKDKILVSVKDHGIGIPKESINKVWERFYKTDLSRGKDKKGTGLGLSITKQIIAAHNENIKVISTEGEGTEFVFSLARAEQ